MNRQAPQQIAVKATSPASNGVDRPVKGSGARRSDRGGERGRAFPTDFVSTGMERVEEAERAAPERKGFILHRPLGPRFSVKRDGDRWRVEGLAAERAVAFADLTVEEAADMAATRLARLGVDEALEAAGATAGDEVRIGDLSFVYTPEPSEEE